jgi:hypothetical protein
MKPVTTRIDWARLARAFKEDSDPSTRAFSVAPFEEAARLGPVYVLTQDFHQRLDRMIVKLGEARIDYAGMPLALPGRLMTVMQVEESDGIPVLIISTDNGFLLTSPPPQTSVLLYREDWEGDQLSGSLFFPEAFEPPEHMKPELADRMNYVAVFLRMAIAALQEPEIVRVEARPPRRTAAKGRSVKVPEYRIASIWPGTEHLVHPRLTQRREEAKKRATPAQHAVAGHWISRRLDEDCTHQFEDITTEEVLKRERCTECGGIRTFRRPFKRGDPTKELRTKLIVAR